MPQRAAGCRIDPALSVPVARKVVPAANAAAEPPEDPPGVISGSHGFLVTPLILESVNHAQQNSGQAVRACIIAPEVTSR